MIGSLHAIGLLAQGRDFLLAGTRPSGRTGHGSRLRSVDDRRLAGDGWCGRWRKARQVCGRRRTRLEAMDINDQPPGIGKQKGRVVRNRTYVQHNTSHIVGKLRDADAFEKSVVDDFY